MRDYSNQSSPTALAVMRTFTELGKLSTGNSRAQLHDAPPNNQLILDGLDQFLENSLGKLLKWDSEDANERDHLLVALTQAGVVGAIAKKELVLSRLVAGLAHLKKIYESAPQSFQKELLVGRLDILDSVLKGINSEDFLSTEALEQETAKLEQQAAKKNAVKKALFFTGALLGIVAVVLLTLYVSWIAAFAVLVVWGVGLCAVAPTRRPEASKKLEVPTTKPIDPPVPVPALVTGPNLGEVTPNVVESYASDRRESDCSYDSDGSESDYEFDEEDTLDEDDKPLRLSP